MVSTPLPMILASPVSKLKGLRVSDKGQKEYLTRRKDSRDTLFVVCLAKPLTRDTALTWFRRRFRQEAGIKKKVTAHVLRNTVATTLLFNGCPIGHIREILDHEHLVTTCKYYLGADERAAKSARAKYLDYGVALDAKRTRGVAPEP
jgi:site-specific recombinase XerD